MTLMVLWSCRLQIPSLWIVALLTGFAHVFLLRSLFDSKFIVSVDSFSTCCHRINYPRIKLSQIHSSNFYLRSSKPTRPLFQSQITADTKTDKKAKPTSKREKERGGSSSLVVDSSELFSSVSHLRGVGPTISSALQSMKIQSIADLIFHLPSGVIDRTHLFDSVRSAHESERSTVTLPLTVVRVEESFQQHNSSAASRPFIIHCIDAQRTPVKLVYFVYKPFVWLSTKAKLAQCNDKINVFGKLTAHPRKAGRLYEYEFYNPEFEPASLTTTTSVNYLNSITSTTLLPSTPNAHSFVKVEPDYKLNRNIKPKAFRKILFQGITSFEKECSDIFIRSAGCGGEDFNLALLTLLQKLKASIEKIHFPESESDSLAEGAPRKGLALIELTLLQLHLIMNQKRLERKTVAKRLQDEQESSLIPDVKSFTKYAMAGPLEWSSALRQSLPFEMTPGQKQATKEIFHDMSANFRMVRLVC